MIMILKPIPSENAKFSKFIDHGFDLNKEKLTLKFSIAEKWDKSSIRDTKKGSFYVY